MVFPVQMAHSGLGSLQGKVGSRRAPGPEGESVARTWRDLRQGRRGQSSGQRRREEQAIAKQARRGESLLMGSRAWSGLGEESKVGAARGDGDEIGSQGQ